MIWWQVFRKEWKDALRDRRTLLALLMSSVLMGPLMLVLVSFAFSLFGFIIGIWAQSFEQLNFIPMLIVTPLTFLGGAFYTVDMLPEAWRGIAQQDVDFVIFLGDYIYESALIQILRPIRSEPTATVDTLDEYRAKYRLYRSDPDLQAVNTKAQPDRISPRRCNSASTWATTASQRAPAKTKACGASASMRAPCSSSRSRRMPSSVCSTAARKGSPASEREKSL